MCTVRSVRVLIGVGVGIACGVVAIVLVFGNRGAHHATTTSPFRPPRYLFDGEFNGRAGSKPSPRVWRAKAYRAGSGTVWSGWSNISEDGKGNLVITAKKVDGAWFSGFLSGRTSYSGPHRIEVRAKVAAGAGVWNAPVWEWDYPHGARGLEDDVVEQLGRQPQTYLTTLHANARIQRGFANATRRTLSSGFHTYAAVVRPNRVDYYLDGKLVRSIRSRSLGGRWGFVRTRMVANISLNMGGLGGAPTVAGPVSLLVDWIRVTPLH